MKRFGVRGVAMVLFATAHSLFLLVAPTPARAAPECSHHGGQTWEAFEENHSFSEQTNLIVLDEVRTNCAFGSFNPYFDLAKAGFGWRPLKHLEIFPAYTFVAIAPGPKNTHEISVEISAIDVPLRFLVLQDGNRIEEDFLSNGTTTRYTNELELSRGMRWEGFRFRPFAEEELKYDLHRRGWDFTRLEAGASKPLSKKLSLRIFYVRQNGSHFSHGIINALAMQFDSSF
jgi:hypothetical protein